MKIAIIGTGGVGGYFGGRLAKAGNEVVFVARGEHLCAMQKNGLTVNSIQGNFKLEKVHATDSIEAIGKVDLVLLCQKAWQVKEIAPKLNCLLQESTAVLTLQNGVTIGEELKAFIPSQNIVNGLCRIISKIEAPGVINHFGVEPTIIFGEQDNSLSERIKAIQYTFEQAEIKSFISRDIQADLWKKFISICVSGLMAVSKCTYGEVARHPQTGKLMAELFQEMYDLAIKMGVKLSPDIVDKTVDQIKSFPHNSTTSMARDIWAGKPSELEYQNGAVVRLGEQYNMPVPVNRFVYYCLLPMELKARKGNN
ncbi:MAG: 2-dehydropantoate 2-reductase [Paludibacteraceae bacterium]|nr:2-dehydropantoate 2-reductase [Paludibacteraceae bacterium]